MSSITSCSTILFKVNDDQYNAQSLFIYRYLYRRKFHAVAQRKENAYTTRLNLWTGSYGLESARWLRLPNNKCSIACCADVLARSTPLGCPSHLTHPLHWPSLLETTERNAVVMKRLLIRSFQGVFSYLDFTSLSP